MMDHAKTLFLFLYRKRYLYFFITGASGIFLNILCVWFLTEFIFGVNRYFIGYITGTIVNISYNFILHTIMTFETQKKHSLRFFYFIIFNLISTGIQIAIVSALAEYFGREYYLLIIASTIFFLSMLSFLFFKHTLFNENQNNERNYISLDEEIALIKTNFRALCLRAKAFFSKDKNILIILLVLAMITRIPYINYPDRTVFDEVLYANFAMHIIDEKPFFDIHPPLVRMIFAEIADNIPFTTRMILPLNTNEPFGDFPYETLRLFIAFLGILLPILLYIIGRLLKFSPLAAGLVAFFVIFDNALIVYSRLILPDMILLILNFLSFAAAIAATQTTQKGERSALVILSGISLGLAISVKWTALAMLPIIVLIFFFTRMLRSIVFAIVLALLSYALIFFLYFTHFPNGGNIDRQLYPYKTSWIEQVNFPKGAEWKNIALYVPQMHGLMIRANTDSYIIKHMTLQSPGPLTWPTGQGFLNFWTSDDKEHSIKLKNNEILIVFAFFCFLFELGWIVTQGIKKRGWPIDAIETLLFFGYILNYVPFYFIYRPMFSYHYFTAFLFLLLLIPRIGPRIEYCIEMLTHDKTLARAIMYFCIFSIFAGFIFDIQTTYGI